VNAPHPIEAGRRLGKSRATHEAIVASSEANPARLIETQHERRLRLVGEMVKQLETKADGKLMDAKASICSLKPTPLKRAASQTWAHIYTRRAKNVRRDEKRLASVVAWETEMERRAAVRGRA
jgi:hypothetical protein